MRVQLNHYLLVLSVAAFAVVAPAAAAAPAQSFELREGDRVVFLGDKPARE
jgi:hypothetical protein